MRKFIAIALIIFTSIITLKGQNTEKELKREVTLYNPYKPSLQDFKKRSSLPEIKDTTTVRPDFKYDVTIKPYYPAYKISPIKAANLLPDPLNELHKSYINLGMGNYLSPLAEISVTSERSKKGALGLYAKHYSSNGKVKLDNDKKVFAGYMDNDVSLFGKKFFKRNFLDGSIDFSQKTRYAYGYDTLFTDYDPSNKDIRLGYMDLGADIGFASTTLDSSDFAYNFEFAYDYFRADKKIYNQTFDLNGSMSRLFKGFYAGGNFEFRTEFQPENIMIANKYLTSLNPFIEKSNAQWNFRLGFEAVLDRNFDRKAKFYIYPDINFGFSIVPSYVRFFTGLSGQLERNDPQSVISENPYMGSFYRTLIFQQPNTDHKLNILAGLKGNNGIGGNYLVSASYEVVDDMLLYSNITFVSSWLPSTTIERGNYFFPISDDAEILNVHGEFSGVISDKITYSSSANWYKYTMTESEYAWNKPNWDIKGSLKYNLRNKIIAGLDITALGERKLYAMRMIDPSPATDLTYSYPFHLNVNLNAEYRYTKLLSFWFKLNNISFNRYYEWAFYPSQRFMGMIGFTYSL